MKGRHWPLALLTFLALGPMSVAASENQPRTGLSATLAPRLAQIGQLEGSFEQTRHISVLSVPLRSSGQFSYQREEGIVWRTLEPVASVIRISPDQGVVIVDDSDKLRPAPATEFLGSIFLGIFSGDFSRLEEYFAIEELSGEAYLEVGHWQLRLSPLQDGLAEHLESILVAGTELVESITLLEVNGDRTDIVFEAAKTGETAH